eukprot:531203-Karenia_brevis.AAC.1
MLREGFRPWTATTKVEEVPEPDPSAPFLIPDTDKNMSRNQARKCKKVTPRPLNVRMIQSATQEMLELAQ